ncbi:MAG: nucleoside 2-deoxyribosyltransferase domain-containing protein [Anaerolineales bacterium]|nr:nucleoside 2-deoxyribosyltransferase domain-containing protein [Anaerolineales bacterium]
MLIYFGAPLFSQAEKVFNLLLTENLEDRGFQVFLPQRDSVESRKPPYNEMNSAELNRVIFTVDRDKLLEADIFLFVLDGRVPDEGACVELGIAYDQKHLLQRDKLLIGLHTDFRGAFLGDKLNAMLQGSLDTIVNNEDDLIAALEEHRHARVQQRWPS